MDENMDEKTRQEGTANKTLATALDALAKPAVHTVVLYSAWVLMSTMGGRALADYLIAGHERTIDIGTALITAENLFFGSRLYSEGGADLPCVREYLVTLADRIRRGE
jgi:hypothetical protein